MSSFIKINKSDINLTPGKKVLKAKDYAAFVESKELLQESEKRAKEQEEQAAQALTGMIQGALSEAGQKVRADQTDVMIETVANSIKHIQQLEAQLAEVVLTAVRKIILDYSDEERVFFAVQSGLKLLCQTQQVTIRVNPYISEDLMTRLNSIDHHVQFIEIVPDEKLAMDDCVLESDIGIINANTKTQIGNLENSIRQHLNINFSPDSNVS